MVQDFSRWSVQELYPEYYPTWRAAFGLLLSNQSKEQLIVVLDEFQYLADASSGLAEVASELNAVWERPHLHRSALLILTGAEVSAMEALAEGGGPIYGRVDWNYSMRV